MNYLYLLTEDDNDDVFFEGCIETLTGQNCHVIKARLRKGSGISSVRSSLRLLIQNVRRIGHVENTCFVIAIDNDRAPEHPEHNQIAGVSKSDQRKPCRFCEIENAIKEELGDDSSKWPIDGAIAVPVQMLESWLLLICDPTQSLPPFAKKSPSAQRFYRSPNPPEQLKDLCRRARLEKEIHSMAEFCLECSVNLLDPDELSSLSPSFKIFADQVHAWKLTPA